MRGRSVVVTLNRCLISAGHVHGIGAAGAADGAGGRIIRRDAGRMRRQEDAAAAARFETLSTRYTWTARRGKETDNGA